MDPWRKDPWADFKPINSERPTEKATWKTFVLMLIFMAVVGAGVGVLLYLWLFRRLFYRTFASYEAVMLGFVFFGGLGALTAMAAVTAYWLGHDREE